jgi:hypothetical protein
MPYEGIEGVVFGGESLSLHHEASMWVDRPEFLNFAAVLK